MKKKAEVILNEFPEIKKVIKEKCVENPLYYIVYSYFDQVNLFFTNFLVFGSILSVILYVSYFLYYLNFDKLSIMLFVVYFSIILYFSVFLSLWIKKRR